MVFWFHFIIIMSIIYVGKNYRTNYCRYVISQVPIFKTFNVMLLMNYSIIFSLICSFTKFQHVYEVCTRSMCKIEHIIIRHRNKLSIFIETSTNIEYIVDDISHTEILERLYLKLKIEIKIVTFLLKFLKLFF